jgi:zinc protease
MKTYSKSLRKFATGLLAAMVCLAALPAPAQEPDGKEESISKVERKNRAPVSKEVLRVQLPRPQEFTLENGLTVLIVEDHRFPAVSAVLNLQGAGGLFDPPEMPGVAGMTAQMLREGTKTRSSRQISEEIDRLGATLGGNAGYGAESASFSFSGLSDNLDDWMALAFDVLVNPTFPKDELARMQQRAKVQLRQQRADPGFLNNERFSQALYRGHPAAVVSSTAAAIDAMTPEVLAAFHRQRYAPQNAILGIAGDVKASELLPKLRKLVAGWKKTDLKVATPAAPAPAGKKKIILVNRPDSVQTSLALGNLAIDRRHPDYIPLMVMNRIIGGGASARLFLNLREEKGYTYGAYSNLASLRYTAPWRAQSSVRTEVTDGAMTEFLYEINRIRDERVPDWEMDDARRSLVANFALSLENPTTLLNYAIIRKVYEFPADYWETYPAKILAVTAEDVQRMARKYLQPDALQIVAVGDASKVHAVLEKYGPVELYDAEGRMMGQEEKKAAPAGAGR